MRCEDREVWVRAYPLPIDAEATSAVAARERTREFEHELLRRRRDHLILRVDRADLSKNVLRGLHGLRHLPRAAPRSSASASPSSPS